MINIGCAYSDLRSNDLTRLAPERTDKPDLLLGYLRCAVSFAPVVGVVNQFVRKIPGSCFP